jgi:hypothetical protein
LHEGTLVAAVSRHVSENQFRGFAVARLMGGLLLKKGHYLLRCEFHPKRNRPLAILMLGNGPDCAFKASGVLGFVLEIQVTADELPAVIANAR